ncbi:MAG: Kelch repeat-containing protein [bacterium]|jgi:hypothetical protein
MEKKPMRMHLFIVPLIVLCISGIAYATDTLKGSGKVSLFQQGDPVNATEFEIVYGFESGWGEWSATNGIWEIGPPTSGPGSAFKGNNVVATVLGGNYPENMSSTLQSPVINLPALPNEDSYLKLEFMSYHSYDGPDWEHYAASQQYYDSGTLSVRDMGTGNETVINRFDGYSESWTKASFDLTAYAGKDIQLIFAHADVREWRGTDQWRESTGWYIDDLRIKVYYGDTLPPAPDERYIPWRQVAANGPEPRREAAMTYDSANNRTLLFGGWDGTNIYGDLWAWNGETWTALANTGPSPRYGASMAYDANRNRVVLFGGATAQGTVDDIWEFDGTQWNQITASGVPKRSHAAMVYDANQQVIILFGGQDVLNRYGDTWKWDGSNWTQIQTTGPTPRASCGLVYNSITESVILFGGRDITNYFNDTWHLVDNQWEQVPATTSPAVRTAFNGMVYDASRDRVVLYGGSNANGAQRDTWEFDGTNWWLVSELGPYNRDGCAITYDSNRRKLVAFGGGNSFKNINALGDTWEYQSLETMYPTWTSTLDFMDEFTRLPGGFGGLPPGNLTVGEIPAKWGYSDGKGVTVTVQPGQVEMLYFPQLNVGENIALLRVSLQADAAGAAIGLAALDGSQDGSVATNIPANSDIFMGDYHRNVLIYDPPSDVLSPIVQVSNLGNSVPVTVYIDNLELYLLPRDKYRRFYSE